MLAKLDDLSIDHKIVPPEKEINFPFKTVATLLGGILFFSVLGLFIWKSLSDNKIQKPSEINNSVVKVAPVVPENTQRTPIILTAGGYIESFKKVTVSSKGTGKVELLAFDEGDEVKAGDVIAKLEGAQLQAQKNQTDAALLIAQARVNETRVNLFSTKTSLRRARILYKKGAITQVELEAAQTRYDMTSSQYQSAKAQVLQAKATLKLAQFQLEDCIIKTPISGTITKIFVKQGEIVNPLTPGGGSAIATIANLKQLRAWADINEGDISKIKTGQEVEIAPNADQNKTYKGKVIKIMPEANRQKNTVEIKIAILDSDDFLKPDMSVKIAVVESSSFGKKKIPVSD